jgi:hypothetical protein
MSDLNQARAEAVREAWKNERALVLQGSGTRDWSQRQQIELTRKGHVNGFDGHHMQSVRTHPKQAGNPQNIQFLNKNEHIKGAHRGNTKNSTNGYYDPATKTMNGFAKGENPKAPQSKLSVPLSQKQINSAVAREKAYQNRVRRDTATADRWRQAQGYAPPTRQARSLPPKNKAIENTKKKTTVQRSSPSTAKKTTPNKGIEAAKQRAATKQTPQTNKSNNKAINNYRSKTGGQGTKAKSAPRSNSSTKGTSKASGAKASSGKASSSGKSR